MTEEERVMLVALVEQIEQRLDRLDEHLNRLEDLALRAARGVTVWDCGPHLPPSLAPDGPSRG